jgi:hypothetical protein
MPTTPTSLSPYAQSSRRYINVLGQIFKYIPQGIVQAAAQEHGVVARARSYPVGSHLAALVFL